MMYNFCQAMNTYLDQEIAILRRLNLSEMNKAVNAIVDALNDSATIYVFGNGGSATTASHMASDFNKGISEKIGRKFRFVCLNDNIPSVTAIANDIGYDEIFRYQLDGLLLPGDLVIGISGSGNSQNILNAIEYAKGKGNKTIGITGYQGGMLKKYADFHMDVMVDDMQIAEDVHMIFNHMMFRLLEDMLRCVDMR